ncbi:MAG: hypothetical protein E7812_13810 [Phenylobacterium sp.]|nr:MAG: hypothetical protein E7812_13810 [Phenylobacterium sp.]
MNWNALIRQAHRWLSIAFALAVVINLTAVSLHKESFWIGLTGLVPMILLLVSGLYLFALPYVAKWRVVGVRRMAVSS